MQYSADIQSILLKNIVVVGGGTSIRGLKERIIRDLIREIPINSEIIKCRKKIILCRCWMLSNWRSILVEKIRNKI